MPGNAALNAYKGLLRATGKVFKGDQPTLLSARQKIRERFDEQRHANLSEKEHTEAVDYANEVSIFLRRNIVQGTKTDPVEDQYHLHITKDTELGDNETTKMPKSTLSAGQSSGGCCGGSPATS